MARTNDIAPKIFLGIFFTGALGLMGTFLAIAILKDQMDIQVAAKTILRGALFSSAVLTTVGLFGGIATDAISPEEALEAVLLLGSCAV